MNKDELLSLSYKILDIEQKCLTSLNLILLNEIENLEIEQSIKFSIEVEANDKENKYLSNESKRKLELDIRLNKDTEYQRKLKIIKDFKNELEKNKLIASNYKRIINIEMAFKGE